MINIGVFFANHSFNRDKINTSHLHKLNNDGTTTVYDFDNIEQPNSYPDAEHELSEILFQLGVNAQVIIDVGERIPETSDSLHYFGRELSKAIAEFSPAVLNNILFVHFFTKKQFEKAKQNRTSYFFESNVGSPSQPVLYNESKPESRGEMVIFIDDFIGGGSIFEVQPSENSLRKSFHRAIGASMMENAPQEFLALWESISMLKRTKFGFELKDLEIKEFILNDIREAFKDDYFVKVVDSEILNNLALRREMEEAVRISKHECLVPLLQELHENKPEAYAYLSHLLALVMKREKEFGPIVKRERVIARPMPEARNMRPRDLARARKSVSSSVDL